MLPIIRPMRSLVAACAVFVVGLSAQTSLAQEDAGAVLEEITVSATRRAETNLQETPVAVSAVSPARLDDIAARDISEAAAFVPNFSASRITAFNAASFAMRGAGQTDIIVYLEPPVGVLVDDFVMPSVQTQLLDTFDIEGLEVLRGPQGTLFGKNTTGGAVVLRTKRPELGVTSADLQIGLGDFGRREAKAALNLPLSDNFALRVVGGTTRTDGFYRNGAAYGPTVAAIPEFTGLSGSGGGERAGGENVTSGRIKALWQVSENFTALAQIETLRDKSDSVPSVNLTPREPGCIPFGNPMAGGCSFVWNSLGVTQDLGDPLDRAAVSNRSDVGLNMGRGQRIDVDGAYLNLEWNISDALTAYSVTGYREQSSRLPNTYTGDVPVSPMFGVISLFDATRDDDRESFQQEFRLNYSAGRSDWVFGAFYSTDETKFCVLQVLGFLDFLGLGQGAFGVPNFFNANPQLLCNAQDTKVFAGFADATFDVTDRFQIGAGVRYTNEEKDWTGRNQVFIQALNGGFNPAFTINQLGEPLNGANFARFPTGVVSTSRDWSEPTWRLTGSFKFTDDVFGYATVSRGFKSGGFNDQTGTSGNVIDTTGPGAFGAYEPEFATSFDLGLKTELFNNRLRLNTAVFYVEYEDAQRAIVATLQNSLGQTFQETRFFNAADVEVQGIEVEAEAAITDRLKLNVSAGYQDGKYKRFAADTNNDGVIDVDFEGQPLTRTPEFAGSIGVSYNMPLASGASLKFNGLLFHEDEQIFILSDLGPQFNGVLNAKDLLSASVTYTSPNEAWWARLYGKNLTDERYTVAVQPVANLWTHGQFGEPQSVGVEFGMRFGSDREPAPRKVVDSDGDGVPDDMDRCPGTPMGTRVDANGCPLPGDADGDGVNDNLDRCPNTPAGARVDANGCELDADGDGVVDRLDQCPGTPAGAKVDAKGCELDSDNDGVLDSKDLCPDTPAGDRVDVNGCSFKEELKLPGVVFETNKAELLDSSSASLNDAVATLKRYPDIKVEVAGHTDSVGSDAYNRRLSQSRAETVMAFLKNAGVANELTARGYGERQPIADNKTEEGRQANRRVVLRILGM